MNKLVFYSNLSVSIGDVEDDLVRFLCCVAKLSSSWNVYVKRAQVEDCGWFSTVCPCLDLRGFNGVSWR